MNDIKSAILQQLGEESGCHRVTQGSTKASEPPNLNTIDHLYRLHTGDVGGADGYLVPGLNQLAAQGFYMAFEAA
jgi:hypothetical protein